VRFSSHMKLALDGTVVRNRSLKRRMAMLPAF
jgi:hypothetical protein